LKVEIEGKYLWFLEYTQSEFEKLQKLLLWEDSFAKSLGNTVTQTLLFQAENSLEFYTFFGLVDLIKDEFKDFEIVSDDRDDTIQNLVVRDDVLDNIILRDYQVMAVRKSINLKTGIIEIPTAGGKCFAKGTSVMMFNGTIKKVEDIAVGDFLMGEDSTSRKVISLARGREEMFKITPKKGEPYVVNRSHILSFKVTHKPECRIGNISLKGGELLDFSLDEYFGLKKTHKHVLKGYRVPVDFSEQPVDIDPYFLGLWLGNGRSDSLPITTPFLETVQYLNEYAFSLGMSLSKYPDLESKSDNYAIVNKSGVPNILLDRMRGYGLIGKYKQKRPKDEHSQYKKHIPQCYLINSREIRLKVLAGLLDTDGYLHPGNYFDLVLVSKKLFDDAILLAQTLGFGTTKGIKIVNGDEYHRVHIYGNIHEIPTCVAHKKASVRKQKKDVLVFGIKVESVGVGDYYGFEIEGNNKRFLLGDCTVVHNTEIALGITKTLMNNKLIKKALVVTPSVPIIKQLRERAFLRGFKKSEIGCVYGQEKDFDKPIIFAVINTMAQGIKEGNKDVIDLVKNADLIVLDECFVGNQHVATEKGSLSIKSLYSIHKESLPKVWSYSDDGDYELRDILKVWKVPAKNKDLIEIKLGKTSIKCSSDHLFLTVDDDWVRAIDLKVGGKLVGFMESSPERKITSIESIESEEYLYDLEVEQNHNYIVGGVVAHNCHHVRSDSFISVVSLSKSSYLIGMSGTPFKDRRNILNDIGDTTIYGLIGRIILKISQKSLVELGYIADTVIFMKPVGGFFKKYKSRYNVIYKREIVDNDIRNKCIVEYCNTFVQKGLSVLVSINIKNHAISLMRSLRVKYPNIRSICIFGGSEASIYDHTGMLDTYKIEQEIFFADFESGLYDVIIATQVMDEGVDLPSVGALIMGGSGKSIRQIRQRLGRGVRSKKTGRNEVFILDFMDRGHVWMFQQSKKRLDIYLNEVESDVLERESIFLDLIESCSS
jgi:superfamily II DNA or RNA helicase